MNFLFWQQKSRTESKPPLVLLQSTPELTAALSRLAREFELQLVSEMPASGDFIFVSSGLSPLPSALPPHIPVISTTEPDLAAQLRKAFLYLEAHDRIRQ